MLQSKLSLLVAPLVFVAGMFNHSVAEESDPISVEAAVTTDLMANVSGGSKRGFSDLYNLDLAGSLDTEKAGLWSGGQVFVYFLGNFGDQLSAQVGDIQTSDNIEVQSDSFKLYEAWYDQSFADSRVSTLIGLHDYNSEFYVLDYASALINSSFGVGPDTSQVGPSIFPTTALAGRVRVQPTEQFYVLSALYDGVPGSPTNPKGTHIHLSQSDGIFYAGEIGFVSPHDELTEKYFKIALGGWYSTTNFEDYAESLNGDNRGMYLIAEKLLFSESDDPAQGLGAFFQFGHARSDRNIIGKYFGVGLHYTGWLPGRDEDISSFGMATAVPTDEYKDSLTSHEACEIAFELTHNWRLADALTLQPDFQYILNPSADSHIPDAMVIGLRIQASM